jgi:hypothetical protein
VIILSFLLNEFAELMVACENVKIKLSVWLVELYVMKMGLVWEVRHSAVYF